MSKATSDRRREVAERTVERLKRFSEHLESGAPVSDAYSCRKVILDVELAPYTPEMVKAVRSQFRLSQALFAKFLNVSLSTVQKWERGVNAPDGAASRLMDEMRHEPEYWSKRFHTMARLVSAPSS